MKPSANWREALSQMELSIGECLTTLGKYEAEFSKVLGHEAEKPVPAQLWSASPTLWDEKLHEAEKQAADVEQLLAEQEALWGKWQQTFAHWQQMVHDAPHALSTVSPTTRVART